MSQTLSGAVVWELRQWLRQYLDLYVKGSAVVVKVAFVETEEKCSVALGGELTGGTDINEVVVVVANHGYQGSRRNGPHQLFCVLDVLSAGRAGGAAAAKRNLSAAGYADALALFDDPAGMSPAVCGAIGKYFDVQFDRLS